MSPNQIKSKQFSFTLLEVMIAISLLALIGGAFFWRLDRMAAKSRFVSDISRFQSILVSTRSLAINTKMDFRLEMKAIKNGWTGRLICREDFDLISPISNFSCFKISWDQQPIKELFLDFYSSGFVGPKGAITLSFGSNCREFKLPEFFYPQEIPTPLLP